MPRQKSAIKQSDVTRAIKGVVAAGVTVEQVEIDPLGKIVIMASCAARVPPPELNKWLAKHANYA